MEELLRLEKVGFCYEGRYKGIENVSAAICKGERVAVLGANGAGKSTFFLCCNGVLRPQSGALFLKGQRLSFSKKDVTRLRRAVGIVFQDPDSQMVAGTVESEVSFGPMNLRLPEQEVRRRTDEALAQMRLDGYHNRAPHQLSGGEKKRVSIADILAMQPELILFDEPTASLDPANVRLLEETLEQLGRTGMALVVSTHDVDFAYRFADRVIVFCEGEIVADAGAEEVFSRQALLARAGLQKPLLYEAYELLRQKTGRAPGGQRPKTMDDFSAALDVLWGSPPQALDKQTL